MTYFVKIRCNEIKAKSWPAFLLLKTCLRLLFFSFGLSLLSMVLLLLADLTYYFHLIYDNVVQVGNRQNSLDGMHEQFNGSAAKREAKLPDVITWHRQEVHHVAFLKVHKAASTTAQNVFLRFGDSRKLTFILAHTHGESRALNVN